MKKSVIALLSSLIVVSTACGTVGLLESQKKEKPVEEMQYKVTYKYYLDNKEINYKPTNKVENNNIPQEDPNNPGIEPMPNVDPNGTETNKEFEFKNFVCTNNVTGEWNEEKWEFTPNLTNDTTCTLYFESNYYNVNLNLTNAIMKDGLPNEQKVNKNEEAIFVIEPKEGHKFESAKCSNEETVNWDEKTNTLKISNINTSTTCSVNYSISDFTVTFEANHGKLTDTQKAGKFGDKITTIITPEENFSYTGDGIIKCSNDQVANYNKETHVLTIDKLSNNTMCGITFEENKLTMTIIVENGDIIYKGIPTNRINEPFKKGNDIKFAITPKTGYSAEDYDLTCKDENGFQLRTYDGSSIQIIKPTKNNTCTLKFKKKETTNTTPNEIKPEANTEEQQN